MVKSAVKVFVRFRPTANPSSAVGIGADGKTITVSFKKKEEAGIINNQSEGFSFKFNSALQDASQESVFSQCTLEVVDAVLNGFNGTVFAYGQTGAGKTYTVAGDTESYPQRGIIPRALHHMFSEIDLRVDRQSAVRVSYLEIYNEVMYDLLAENPANADALSIMEENGVTKVKGLTKKLVASEEEALAYFFEGEAVRSVASHTLNKQSSRSHVIFTIHLETRVGEGSSERVTSSKLNCVDLAGSERTKKTQVTGQTLKEAMFINKSLTFLEQTVNALSKKDAHVPYRNTKLTDVLKDALGGNCRTVMVATIWAEDTHLEETVSTLRFASRVKMLQTDAVVNEKHDPALLVRRYERLIAELKQELAMRDTLSGRSNIAYGEMSDADRYDLQAKVVKYLADEVEVDALQTDTLRQIKETFKQFKTLYVALKASGPALMPPPTPSAGGGAGAGDAGLLSGGGYDMGPGGVTLVGEEDKDGKGFNVGQAPSTARPTSPSSSPTKQPGGLSSAPGGWGGPPRIEGETSADFAGAVLGEAATTDKGAAFQQYKSDSEQGRELAGALKAHQHELRDRKQALRDTGAAVNTAKADIDRLGAALAQKRSQKPASGGPEDVTDAEEYELAAQLKAAKLAYRAGFDQLRSIRADIDTAASGVQSSREELVAAFEAWYTAARANASRPPAGADEDDGELLDEGEKFEKMYLERILKEDPESSPFYAAQSHLRKAKKPLQPAAYAGDKGRAETLRKQETAKYRV